MLNDFKLKRILRSHFYDENNKIKEFAILIDIISNCKLSLSNISHISLGII